MTVRRMDKSDEAEVSRLYVKSWQEGYKGLLPQDYLDSLNDWHWESKFTDLPGSFVITDGEKIVGHSCARKVQDMPDWGEVWTLYILPRILGQGIWQRASAPFG